MTQPPAAEPIIAAEAVDEQTKPAPHPIFPEREAPAEPLAPHPRPGHAPFEAPFAPPPAVPHPIEPSFVPPPSPAPPCPQTSWADWLAAFMEERNIRWGELVGGLLIVCCSIALVISFWSRIAEMPLVQFLLFNGVTAALFGVGFYSEHRWRLHTTSQGLLTIASMLVPLNFLAIAAVTTAAAANNPLVLGGEAVSTVLFAALLFFGGRSWSAPTRWRSTVGIIVPALVQLLVRRFVDAEVIPAHTLGVGRRAVGLLWNWPTAGRSRTLPASPASARKRANRAVQVSGPDHVCRGAAAGTDSWRNPRGPCHAARVGRRGQLAGRGAAGRRTIRLAQTRRPRPRRTAHRGHEHRRIRCASSRWRAW